MPKARTRSTWSAQRRHALATTGLTPNQWRRYRRFHSRGRGSLLHETTQISGRDVKIKNPSRYKRVSPIIHSYVISEPQEKRDPITYRWITVPGITGKSVLGWNISRQTKRGSGGLAGGGRQRSEGGWAGAGPSGRRKGGGSHQGRRRGKKGGKPQREAKKQKKKRQN